jgi:hypothetical protein
MNRKERLAEIHPDLMFADGFDEALVGYVEVFTSVVALYDRDKCIRILIDEGMSYEEAEDYFSSNKQGAYVGEYTPGFATFLLGAEPSPVDADDWKRRAEQAEKALVEARTEIALLKGAYDA